MSQFGHGEDLEKMNRIALGIARDVAEETGTLFAGGVSNTDLLADPSIEDPAGEMRAMFEEQIRWAKEEGVDYIIAETIHYFEEASIALEVIKSFDLPAVVTFGVDPGAKDGKLTNDEGQIILADGVPVVEACRRLVEMGAEIVGVNCLWGPGTMMDMVEEIIKVVPPEKVAALPIAYRTTKEEPTWIQFTDKNCPDNNPVWPNGVDAFYISELEITKFTKRCLELGLKYIGICCGNTGNYTRAMAEAMGRKPLARKYRDPEMLAKGAEWWRMREIGMERTKAQAKENH